MTDVAPEISLDAAARRLTAAVESLERHLGIGPDAPGDLFVSSAFDSDRQRLASELDGAQARVRELESAAEEAVSAVDHAVTEIRSALQDAADRRSAPEPEEA